MPDQPILITQTELVKSAVRIREVVTQTLFGSAFVIKVVEEQLKTAPPKIVLFADLSGSTEAAKENIPMAFVRTIAHHFAHGIASHGLAVGGNIEEGVLKVVVKIVRTIGDEVVITYGYQGVENEEVGAPDARLDDPVFRARVASLLERVVESALDTRDALNTHKVSTKVGIHLCSRYVVPLRVLSASGVLQELSTSFELWEAECGSRPEMSAFFPPEDLLGHDMNLAARVAHSANADDVIVSEEAYSLLAEHGTDSLSFSAPLRFQGWKGIVDVPSLAKLTSVQVTELDRSRTARLASRGGDRPQYRWPFHAVALVAAKRPGSANPRLSSVIAHRELRSNLIAAYAVDQEERLKVFPDGDQLEEWRPPEHGGQYFGVLRSCASSFDVYNDVMRYCIYARLADVAALTYSSPIMASGAPIENLDANFKVSEWLQAQPADIAWRQAEPSGEKKVILFLRTRGFDNSRSVLSYMVQQLGEDLIDGGLLYGEWDIFGIVRGDTDAFKEFVHEWRANLRADSQLECGLLLRVRALS